MSLFGLDGLFGGIMNLAGNVQQQAYTKENMKLQSRLNREEQEHSMGLQRDYQNMVWDQGASREVAALKNSGINPSGFNGPTAMSASPSSGASGPPAHGDFSYGSAMIDAAASAQRVQNETELAESQKKNIDADTRLKESQTKNTEADTKIKEWRTDPSILDLERKGMEANVLKTYASADVDKATVVKIGRECDLIGSQMGLNDAQKTKLQAEVAKYRTEIASLVQGMDESQARILLYRAQTATESAKQNDLNASAAEHRAGVVEKHASARLRGAQTKETASQQKLNEIETKMREFKQKVIEISGDAHEQGSIMGAKRLVSLVNPFSDPF